VSPSLSVATNLQPKDTKILDHRSRNNVFYQQYLLNEVKRKIQINMRRPSSLLTATAEYEKFREDNNEPDLALLTLAMELYNKAGKPHATEGIWKGTSSLFTRQTTEEG
jgi:hypothetical protein